MTKKALVIFLSLLLLISFVPSVYAQTYIGLKRVTVGEKSGAWLEDWAYRKEITINSTKVDGDLTDFPVLVYLSSASGESDLDVTSIFDVIGSSYNKIAFTKDDATTRLYFEVEYWNATSETAYVWVKVPSIANSPDTKIYIYYDSTKDGSAYHAAEQVWESSAVMVQHLEETSGTLYDSTANNNDGTNYGATYGATGQIDNALSFDGVDDCVISSKNLISGNFSALTYMVWVKADVEWLNQDAWGYRTVMALTNFHSGTFRFKRISNYIYCMEFLSGNNPSGGINGLGLTSSSFTLDTTWHLYTFVWTGTTYVFYRDGNPIGTGSATGALSGNLQVYIASDDYNEYIKSVIDEVRIYNLAKPNYWIKADYYSGIDSLVTYGTEYTPSSVPYPENIVVTKLTENYDVYLYNATTLVCNATVGSDGNATLTLPSEYREDTFEGTFKIYDENDNHILTQVFDDTRGGDEYEALQETTNIWILGYMFGAMGFVFGVFALIYMRNKKEKEEGKEFIIEEEEYYTEEESWQ